MTALLAVAVTVGALLGLLAGGRRRTPHVPDPEHLWLILAAGLTALVGNLLGLRMSEQVSVPAYLLQNCLVGAWCLANLRLPGVRLLAAGVLMNILVVAANWGMPVAVDDVDPSRGLYVPIAPQTVFAGLGDWIQLGFAGRAIGLASVGDLLMATGAAYLAFCIVASRRTKGGQIVA